MNPSSYSPSSWFSTLGSAMVQGINLFSGSGSTTPYEDRVEEFGLLISLAVGKRLPEGSKPARSNHRIIWNTPEPLRPTDSTTLDKQGATRRVSHILGYTNTDHRQIIAKWPTDIQNAIKIHLPKNLMEQDSFIIDCKLRICLDAIDQLKRLSLIYTTKNDGTDDKLDICIRYLENRLEQDDVVQRLRRNSLSPSASLLEAKTKDSGLMASQGLEEKEIKEENTRSMSPPISIPFTVKQPKRASSSEGIDDYTLISIEDVRKGNSLSLQGSSPQIALTVDEKMAALWQERFLFEILQMYFRDLDILSLSERVESNSLFSATITAIDGLIGQRSGWFEKHLVDSTQYSTR